VFNSEYGPKFDAGIKIAGIKIGGISDSLLGICSITSTPMRLEGGISQHRATVQIHT
jgi:hypothetical protein